MTLVLPRLEPIMKSAAFQMSAPAKMISLRLLMSAARPATSPARQKVALNP